MHAYTEITHFRFEWFFAAPTSLVQIPSPLLIWTAGVEAENPRTTSDDRSDEKTAELAASASASICHRCLSRVAAGRRMENLWNPRRSLPPLQQPQRDSLTCPRTSSYRSGLRASRPFLRQRQFSCCRGFRTESFPSKGNTSRKLLYTHMI